VRLLKVIKPSLAPHDIKSSFIFSLAAFFVTIFIAGNPENLMSFYYESSTVKADIYTDVYINISVDYMFVIYLFYVTIFFLVIILIF